MAMRGKRIASRQGIEFTADIATDSEWFELAVAIGRAISRSPLVATGLQEHCEIPRQNPDALPSIKLYSTGNTTVEQVRELLEHSVPEVVGVRKVTMRKVQWSEVYHPEYEIDSPNPDPGIPSDLEFASGHKAVRGARELDYDLDGSYDEDSPLGGPTVWPEPEDKDLSPLPPDAEERMLGNKRKFLGAKAAWLHRQQPNFKADAEGRRGKPSRKPTK